MGGACCPAVRDDHFAGTVGAAARRAGDAGSSVCRYPYPENDAPAGIVEGKLPLLLQQSRAAK